MKLRAFAVIAALALPAAASAQPGSSPPNNGPSTGAAPSAGPQSPSSPSSGVAPRSGGPSNAPSASSAADGSSPSSGPAVPSGSPSTTGASTGASGNGPSTQPPSANNDQSPTTPSRKGDKFSDTDSKIVAHLHHVNQMEINLAKQAQKQGTAHVKDYANTILTDHQTNDRELTSMAKNHKLATIPADKPQSDADRQDEKDMTVSVARLKTLKGADFDKEYINMMVSDHDKELTRIDTSISAASDPDLKSLLQSTKPVLQRHADQGRDLQKSPQASLATPAAKQP
jgi:putative membrane protein